MVYSYYESLREDPSGSIAGFDQETGTAMVWCSTIFYLLRDRSSFIAWGAGGGGIGGFGAKQGEI